ncbi:hypothetical protein V8F20_012788 [Naviculisporaceae sp. PSN 640]
MRLFTFLTLVFSIGLDSVRAGFLSARSLEHGSNVELGDLVSLDEFHSLMGPEFHGGLEYEDVTEYETLDEDAVHKRDHHTELDKVSRRPSEGEIFTRADECKDMTGWSKLVCENMPSRMWFWGVGGALGFYYTPSVMANFMISCANVVKAGRDLRNVWRDDSVGGATGLIEEVSKRRERIDYHFTLPHVLDARGKPHLTRHARRSLIDEERREVNITTVHDYVYSERDQTIYYKATRASLSSSGNPPKHLVKDGLEERALTVEYTINMHLVRRTPATTIASTTCIASLLKYHINRSSETQRFACRPIDNQGSWRATMWLMINKGRGNTGTYGYCC